MSKIWLEVAEDRSRPEGGHAIIRLHGLARPAQMLTFTINPIDGNGAGATVPVNGAHAPLSTRVTSDGVELVIGPDVVENPALLPGTPVAIEVPGAGVRAEVLWPSITPLARAKRQPVVMTTARRLALVQASRDHGRNGSGNSGHHDHAAVSAERRMPVEGVLATHAPLAAGALAAAAPQMRIVSAKVIAPVLASAPGIHALHLAADNPSLANPNLVQHPVLQSAPILAAAKAPPVVVASLAPAASMAALNNTVLVAARPQQAALPAERYLAPETDRIGRRLSGLAMMMALMAIGSSLLVLQMMRSMRGQREPTPLIAAAQPTVQLAPLIAAPPSAMFEIFKVGPTSPNGTRGNEADLAKALSLADAYIHSAGPGRDLREGQYWLQRALVLSLGDDRNRWALTQLGSMYAAPTEGDPNYEKARLLWEIAAGLGDTVAMCFLGNLHQYGLGVPTSRSMALRWYELSAQSGGCRGLDDLIARVKR